MTPPDRTARRRIESTHDDVVAAVDECADRATDRLGTDRVADRDALTDALRTSLEATGVLDRLPTVLADVVAATGHGLRAEPVPAPPYVVVTSRGPILRATIEPGRLVVRFDAFDVERPGATDGGPVYRRRDDVDLSVSLR